MGAVQFVPLYTTYDNVKVRLANKVQFQEDPDALQVGQLPDSLLGQLICDAETEVERDLCGRYAIPFQSISKGQFKSLPDHSQRAIRMAVDLRAVVNIMETDFGRGTNIEGETYKNPALGHYNSYIKKLMGQDNEGNERERFRFSPPLSDLMLSPQNREADDGYKGMIINTDAGTHGAESYAEHQINNPGGSILRRGGIFP